MTNKQINEQLIKDVETAVNNVANAYNGAFKIKKSDEGTDRVSNFTLCLTSSEWNKDAQIKFSIDSHLNMSETLMIQHIMLLAKWECA